MSNQLLPCPFCGHDEPTHDEGDESAWVQCTNAECGTYGPITSGPALAAAAWNRRATQPAFGEPKQQTAINADDLPTKKYPLGAFDFDSTADAPVAAGEPIQVEAVAVTREGGDGLYLDWVLEGGISALEAPGVVLLVSHGTVTDDQGSGEVYLAPPAVAHGDDPAQWTDQQVRNFLATALRHVDVKGTLHCQDIRDGFKVMRAQAGEGGEV